MSLEVLEISGLATIQDEGRTGWRRFGVPASGPMDTFAFQAANALVGNTPDCAVVEMGLGDVVFRARQDCIMAVTGAGYAVSVYVWEFPLWDSFMVRAGWKIHLRKTDGGLWAYLAVSGGIQTQPALGSRSTYLRGGLGGLQGRSLRAGDLLQMGNSPQVPYELAARTLVREARPEYSEQPIIEIILGPQREYFTEESVEKFLSSEYSVSLTSDRMGYRLDGPALTLREKGQLISEGMTFGAIQVPASGQPIVMMADCPTTGGYPKIGTVASRDLPILAQCLPNKSRIRFRETTIEQAQERYRAMMNKINNIVHDE
jgi:antagonist of KipI